MLRLWILPVMLTLGGCAGSVLGDAVAGPEAVAAREDGYCQSIGLRFGTPEYANCRMTVGSQRQQAHQAAISGALNGMQQSFQPPPTINCTSQRMGTITNTSCQ